MTPSLLCGWLLVLIGPSLTLSSFDQYKYKYKYGPDALTTTPAEEYCKNEGGTLASIHSDEELRFVRDLARESAGLETNIWIGGTNVGGNGDWKWLDETAFNFERWKWKNGAKREGQCAYIYTKYQNIRTRNCDTHLAYKPMCKWKIINGKGKTITFYWFYYYLSPH